MMMSSIQNKPNLNKKSKSLGSLFKKQTNTK